MAKHLLDELSAEELVQDSFQSELIDILAKILTSIKEKLIHPTDDFERWDIRNKEVLNKILEEFKYTSLFSSQDFLTSLQTRPELLWALTRTNPNKAGLELFFKIFGVYENLDTTLPGREISFHNRREDISDNNSCFLPISIDSSRGLKDEATLIAKLEAINIFTELKIDLCQEIEIKMELETERQVFSFISYGVEIVQFETDEVQYNNVATTQSPITVKGYSKEVAEFEAGSFYK